MKTFKGTKNKFTYRLVHESNNTGGQFDNGWFEIIGIHNEDYLPPLADIKFYPNHTTTKEIAEANAKLFTASKDLLEALQEMVEILKKYKPASKDLKYDELPTLYKWENKVFKKAEKAINKAL